MVKPSSSAGKPGRWYSIHRKSGEATARTAAISTTIGKKIANSTCSTLGAVEGPSSASSRAAARASAPRRSRRRSSASVAGAPLAKPR
ncbi:hypothetical protein ACFFX0_26555 [Citricoccus parietis]|uniref:Uncharacterized protein n=1 Tax=Citricoccus parietis TaxID=592307 RepID=A0ABV5G6H4_9MICC